MGASINYSLPCAEDLLYRGSWLQVRGLGEGESKAEESETIPQDRPSLSAHAGTSEQFSE